MRQRYELTREGRRQPLAAPNAGKDQRRKTLAKGPRWTPWRVTDKAPRFEEEGDRAAGARYVVDTALEATVSVPARAMAGWATRPTPCRGDDQDHRINRQLLVYEPQPAQVRKERIEVRGPLLRENDPRLEEV
jgi:hypothetical protein